MLLCLNTNLQVEASPGLLGKLIVEKGAAIGLGGLLAKGPPNINIEDQRTYNSGDVDIDNSSKNNNNKGVIGDDSGGNGVIGDNNNGHNAVRNKHGYGG